MAAAKTEAANATRTRELIEEELHANDALLAERRLFVDEAREQQRALRTSLESAELKIQIDGVPQVLSL